VYKRILIALVILVKAHSALPELLNELIDGSEITTSVDTIIFESISDDNAQIRSVPLSTEVVGRLYQVNARVREALLLCDIGEYDPRKGLPLQGPDLSRMTSYLKEVKKVLEGVVNYKASLAFHTFDDHSDLVVNSLSEVLEEFLVTVEDRLQQIESAQLLKSEQVESQINNHKALGLSKLDRDAGNIREMLDKTFAAFDDSMHQKIADCTVANNQSPLLMAPNVPTAKTLSVEQYIAEWETKEHISTQQMDELLSRYDQQRLINGFTDTIKENFNMDQSIELDEIEDIGELAGIVHERLNNFSRTLESVNEKMKKDFEAAVGRITQIRTSLCTACSTDIQRMKATIEQDVNSLFTTCSKKFINCKGQLDNCCLELENALKDIIDDMCIRVVCQKKDLLDRVDVFEKNWCNASQAFLNKIIEEESGVIRMITVNKNDVLEFLGQGVTQFYNLIAGQSADEANALLAKVAVFNGQLEQAVAAGATAISKQFNDFSDANAQYADRTVDQITQLQVDSADSFQKAIEQLGNELIAEFNNCLIRLETSFDDQNVNIQQAIQENCCCAQKLADDLCLKLLSLQKNVTRSIDELIRLIFNGQLRIHDELIITEHNLNNLIASFVSDAIALLAAMASFLKSLIELTEANQESLIELVATLGEG